MPDAPFPLHLWCDVSKPIPEQALDTAEFELRACCRLFGCEDDEEDNVLALRAAVFRHNAGCN